MFFPFASLLRRSSSVIFSALSNVLEVSANPSSWALSSITTSPTQSSGRTLRMKASTSLNTICRECQNCPVRRRTTFFPSYPASSTSPVMPAFLLDSVVPRYLAMSSLSLALSRAFWMAALGFSLSTSSFATVFLVSDEPHPCHEVAVVSSFTNFSSFFSSSSDMQRRLTRAPLGGVIAAACRRANLAVEGAKEEGEKARVPSERMRSPREHRAMCEEVEESIV
mmetsp:Transcript_3295/g.7599  ORF Transcript_3295/g.7599 Transcript_3295/m.7599 type:complete len:224 (+) Transcript_3295:280-951(+)